MRSKYQDNLLRKVATHTVSRKNKRNAVIIVLISFGSTIVFAVDKLHVRIILSLVAFGLITIILLLPSSKKSARTH